MTIHAQALLMVIASVVCLVIGVMRRDRWLTAFAAATTLFAVLLYVALV